MSNSKKTSISLVGKVSSDKMDKSVSVIIERLVKHSAYGKYVRRSTKVMAHDETNECREGDVVEIKACRPMSKKKAWIVSRVLTRAA